MKQRVFFFYYDNNTPFYFINNVNASQNYNCGNGSAVAIQACSVLNATSPLVAQCSQWVADTTAYYQNCICDTTLADDDIGWAESAIDNYIKQCEAQCFGCALTGLPTSALTSVAYGPGIGESVYSEEVQTFYIQPKDILGNNVVDPNANFVITSTGPGGIAFRLQYTAPLWTVTYVANLDGGYIFKITYNNVAINGSPYSIFVDDDPAND